MTATNTTSLAYPSKMVEDLAKSGLSPEDMKVKPLGAAEKTATGAPMGSDGYVLPYFAPDGKALPFYRAKLYDTPTGAPKYRQVADSPNHVYFPPGFGRLIGSAKYILITEGEKKAGAAVKAGYPCVALGGVDSWRNRTLVLPKATEIGTKKSGSLTAKLPSGMGVQEAMDTLAVGIQSLIDFAIQRQIPLILVYDTDMLNAWRPEVQRAASAFAFELRFRGVPFRLIRQLILPNKRGEDGGVPKVGLDDFLVDSGKETFAGVLQKVLDAPSAFPRHPNPRDYVNKRLQRPNLPRADQQAVAMAILSDLDARGQRLRAPDAGNLYYFSNEDKSLIPINFNQRPEFAESPFGRKLYRDYGLGWSDNKVMAWVMTLFSGEEPMADVYPKRVMTWIGNTLYYQLNAGQIVRVTVDKIEVVDNGTDGVLFETTDDALQPIEESDFKLALVTVNSAPLNNWWYDVMKLTRIRESKNDYQRRLLAYLYYVSPFFYRWRGTQLPVEITTGEAGSGKSTLLELRLSILTGVPKLRNAPSDLKDWNAGLASTGALHVTDNVQLVDQSLKQRLSDEICRLITEPKPSIEQRKLYTDVGVVKIPVECVFAITAIKQPFTNVDIIQRAVITDLDKGTDGELTYDAEWKTRQLDRFGGRASWLAHHLIVVQHTLGLIGKFWDPHHKARYRLINVEQLLLLVARVFGEEAKWIPGYLEGSRDARVAEGDWALEGIKAYADFCRDQYDIEGPRHWSKYRFTSTDVALWCEGNEDYAESKLLVDPRQVGRYLEQNKHTCATVAGIEPAGMKGNKKQYSLRAPNAEKF